MTQSRRMSLIEAVTNVAVGYVLAVTTQIVVFPWFGLHPEPWREPGAGRGLRRHIAPAQLCAAQAVRTLAITAGHQAASILYTVPLPVIFSEVIGRFSFFLRPPEIRPLAECANQPVASTISAMDAPSGR